MEIKKNGSLKISGSITIACALGITILHVLQGENLDSYILPFILLMLGISFLFRRPTSENRQIKMSRTARKIVIAALSISLVAGILTMLLSM